MIQPIVSSKTGSGGLHVWITPSMLTRLHLEQPSCCHTFCETAAPQVSMAVFLAAASSFESKCLEKTLGEYMVVVILSDYRA